LKLFNSSEIFANTERIRGLTPSGSPGVKQKRHIVIDILFWLYKTGKGVKVFNNFCALFLWLGMNRGNGFVEAKLAADNAGMIRNFG
jgi:hypothetical protein